MVGNHSDKKEKGYDGRGVGNSCLCKVSFEVVLAKRSEARMLKYIPVMVSIIIICNRLLVHFKFKVYNTFKNKESSHQDVGR